MAARRRLTHLDKSGVARMVDVGGKRVTNRVAVAEGTVAMAPATLAQVVSDDFARERKGNVIAVARLAGIMAAKRTHELIPLAHPLALTSVNVEIESDTRIPGLRVRATVKTSGKTGVEMEALTAVSVACLTVYDMAKSVDRGMVIGAVRLTEKRGGRSGTWRSKEASLWDN
jgi:cyclic pyranopterin phosphate synthase